MAGRAEVSSEGLRLTQLRESDGGRFTCVVASDAGYEAESVWLRVEPTEAAAGGSGAKAAGVPPDDLLLQAFQSDADAHTPPPRPRPPQRRRDHESSSTGTGAGAGAHTGGLSAARNAANNGVVPPEAAQAAVSRDGRRVVLLRATGRTSPNGITDIVWEVPAGGLARVDGEELVSFSIQYRSLSSLAQPSAQAAVEEELVFRQESGWHTLIEGLAPAERRVRAMVPVADGAMLFRALAFLRGPAAHNSSTGSTTADGTSDSYPLTLATHSPFQESPDVKDATEARPELLTTGHIETRATGPPQELVTGTFPPDLEEEPVWDDGSEAEPDADSDQSAYAGGSTTASGVQSDVEPVNADQNERQNPTRPPQNTSSSAGGRSTSRVRRPAGAPLDQPFLVFGARSELVVHVLGALCLVLFVVLLLVLLLIICTGRRRRRGSHSRRRNTPSTPATFT